MLEKKDGNRVKLKFNSFEDTKNELNESMTYKSNESMNEQSREEEPINKESIGRPYKNEKDKRDKRVYSYLTEDEKEKYYRYCASIRKDASDDLREYILGCINQ
ncbi:hypothetical protein [Sporosalibacterium faouarense]|uniref:hypothetical protein n=1 Tax=Sporosalibacterium faouarense TaxID=516123 RepID=UPI00192C3B67|nr:hypothetical protein [Sporosalibacterium faouarense]